MAGVLILVACSNVPPRGAESRSTPAPIAASRSAPGGGYLEGDGPGVDAPATARRAGRGAREACAHVDDGDVTRCGDVTRRGDVDREPEGDRDVGGAVEEGEGRGVGERSQGDVVRDEVARVGSVDGLLGRAVAGRAAAGQRNEKNESDGRSRHGGG